MKEILDEDIDKHEITPVSIRLLINKASNYIVVMLLGGVILRIFIPSRLGESSIFSALALIIGAMLLTILIEFVRLLWRKIWSKKHVYENPYWFEFIENVTSIWILMVVSDIVVVLLRTY